MRNAAAILLCGVAATSTASDLKCWKAPRYQQHSIPAEWLTPGIPDQTAGMAAFAADAAPYVFSVSGFEKLYGPPSAYFTITGRHANGQGYLIFALQDGGSLAAVVWMPPADAIGAFVQHDRNCKFVKLIK